MNKGGKGTSKPTGHGAPRTGGSSMGGGNIGATGAQGINGLGKAGNHGTYKSGATAPRANPARGFNVGGGTGVS